MVRACLGLVLFSGVIVVSGCSDSKRPSHDGDAGEGGQAGDASGAAGKGGAAGSSGTSGRGGRGGASGTAGNAGSAAGRGGTAGGSAGGSDDGSAGEGGSDGGSAGNAGDAGDGNAGESGAGAGGAAGSAGEGSAGQGNAGAGGEPSTLTGCERTPGGAVLASADFSSDVFGDSAWTRSDTSVAIAGGLLAIGADTGYDDYVEVALTNATLPVVIELRARTAETAAISDVLPIIVAFYEGRWVDATYSSSWGWMLSNDSAYAESQLLAPAQGEWVSLRVLLDTTTSELCAKRDSDEAYGRVVTTSMALPSAIPAVRVRQAWDYRYELDALRVLKP